MTRIFEQQMSTVRKRGLPRILFELPTTNNQIWQISDCAQRAI